MKKLFQWKFLGWVLGLIMIGAFITISWAVNGWSNPMNVKNYFFTCVLLSFSCVIGIITFWHYKGMPNTFVCFAIISLSFFFNIFGLLSFIPFMLAYHDMKGIDFFKSSSKGT